MSDSSVSAWVAAARPRTLPASIVPVVVGLAVAARHGSFNNGVAAVTLLAAILIQIATNLANDYYDFIKGADDEHRIGPSRASQSGSIAATTVRNAALGVLFAAAMAGVYLVSIGGLPILGIGITSLVCALAYTAGPYPLAYRGLGDIFVFIFFGPTAVLGTYYLQTGTIDAVAVVVSVPIGLLSAAILVVNNLRDIAGDARVGKRTMAVRIGAPATRIQYAVSVLAAVVIQAGLVFSRGAAFAGPLLVTPLALYEIKAVYTRNGAELNASLAGTARLLVVFGGALVAGLMF